MYSLSGRDLPFTVLGGVPVRRRLRCRVYGVVFVVVCMVVLVLVMVCLAAAGVLRLLAWCCCGLWHCC